MQFSKLIGDLHQNTNDHRAEQSHKNFLGVCKARQDAEKESRITTKVT